MISHPIRHTFLRSKSPPKNWPKMFSVALSFLLGLLSGVVLLALLLLALLITFYGDRSASAASDQSVSEDDQLTMRTRIPPELKAFMRSGPDASGSDWERCGALSLLLHFLFQEHKDTRQFRRLDIAGQGI